MGETEEGTPILNDLLRAQQEFSQAESDYYRAVVNYNRSIAQVHFRKGSLLEYNGVYLAEGNSPGKAYFDARRRSRARAASTHLDYGFTQPKVISRGPIEQNAGGEGYKNAEVFKGGELFKSGEASKQGVPTAAPPKPEAISAPSAAFPAEPPYPGPMAEPKPEPMIVPEPATKPSRGGPGVIGQPSPQREGLTAQESARQATSLRWATRPRRVISPRRRTPRIVIARAAGSRRRSNRRSREPLTGWCCRPAGTP